MELKSIGYSKLYKLKIKVPNDGRLHKNNPQSQEKQSTTN